MKVIFKKFCFIFIISIFLVFTLFFISYNYFQPSNGLLKDNNIKKQGHTPDYWPTSGWRTALPETQGISPYKLQAMKEYIESENIEGYIDSLLIVRNGYLIYESYPSQIYNTNMRHHIYSCTKVFTSALVGIALEEGYISGLNDYVLDYFPNKTFDNMDSRKEAMTIKDLLTMTSGLEWIDNEDYYRMAISYNWVNYVLNRPMEYQPGLVWNYNSGGSHVLSAILDKVTPTGTFNYARTKIFNHLNITNYSWNLDRQGIPNGGTLLHLTPRDMAKFGYLYLNNGTWNGAQLIPTSWIVESTTPYKSVGFDQGHGSGYGYKWWTYNWLNAYTARGSYEQVIVVIPDLNMVVVATGNEYYQFIRLLVDFILPSADFVPIDPIVIISVIISVLALGTFIGATYIHFRKKRTIQKLRKEFFEDAHNDGKSV